MSFNFLGDVVREARTSKNITQQELASSLGVSRLWVSKLEAGNPGANIGDVLAALELLDRELVVVPVDHAAADEIFARVYDAN